ncbi:putative short-chain dehydrogenase [Colletotrichum kahawae]|uniref:Short-chain dehydrogenase n=1 Tax=Colletotrichum kahawae TaxID=34407 RepID=A0AAD9YJH2_COLKA|nr:putative short-chain dehydrogenase [Colletotrichum kahawae]
MVLASLRNLSSQWFPPAPTFTEDNVPPQHDRVFIVTGGNAGVGFELVKMLYTTGATIYMASRSKVGFQPRSTIPGTDNSLRQERAEKAIEAITTASPAPKTPGRLNLLLLDLNDLESVKSAAASFAQQESKLDVLWNNAGTGGYGVKPGATTAQGFQAMVGMHCIAAQLFTHLLTSHLRAAAATAPKGSVRVVWTSSFLAEGGTPANGIDFDTLETGTPDLVQNYAVSKLGNWMLGREMALRYRADGIVSVTQNPGNIRAGSYAGTPGWVMMILGPLMYETKLGGCTELYAGLSSEVSLETSGCYVIPFGRIRADADCPRKHLINAMKAEDEGGLGYAARFWDWREEKWKPFV